VWAAWHSIIEDKWRHRVEKACQAKAQEVCMQLTNDYETKISSVSRKLLLSGSSSDAQSVQNLQPVTCKQLLDQFTIG
jgi:hypothetical protein